NETDPLDANDNAATSSRTTDLFSRYALYAFGRLRINDGVQCTTAVCRVGALGNSSYDYALVLGRSSSVDSAWAGGDVWLRDYATVSGALYTRDTVVYQSSNYTAPSVEGNAEISDSLLPMGFSLPSVPDLSDEDSVQVSAGDSYSLAPGNYSLVKVNNNATLILSGGDYRIGSFSLAYASALQLDTSNGEPVRIFASGELNWKCDITSGGEAKRLASKLLLVYYGTSLTLERNFAGAVLAPNASLSLGQTGKDFYGMAIGQNVEIHQYSRIHYQPFFYGLKD
ncbi:MAG TPA: collagen-binding domain-containing protein, partial [Fibrobacteraceae bacterium]|nr:collagen-binding domain-containing protein [Fibrobacteraceae bacterium]